jgi:hypothetical protein
MSDDKGKSQIDGACLDKYGELQKLREENTRLKALLTRHGISGISS